MYERNDKLRNTVRPNISKPIPRNVKMYVTILRNTYLMK